MTNQENEDEITVQADSQQLEIFRNFYGKDADQSTNLFNAWDFYGVYAISRRDRLKCVSSAQTFRSRSMSFT